MSDRVVERAQHRGTPPERRSVPLGAVALGLGLVLAAGVAAVVMLQAAIRSGDEAVYNEIVGLGFSAPSAAGGPTPGAQLMALEQRAAAIGSEVDGLVDEARRPVVLGSGVSTGETPSTEPPDDEQRHAVAVLTIGPYEVPAIVVVSATSATTLAAPRQPGNPDKFLPPPVPVEAQLGLRLTIAIDGDPVANDFRQGLGWHVTLAASAAHVYVMPAGTVATVSADTVRIRSAGYGPLDDDGRAIDDDDTNVRLSVVAIAAPNAVSAP